MAEKSETGSVEEASEQLAVFTDTLASFNKTIETLRESYSNLQIRYQKLDDELTSTNEKLRRTLDEHLETRNFLYNVLESLTSGVITIDRDGQVTTVNRAGCLILQCRQEEIIGSDYVSLFGGTFSSTSSLSDLLNGVEPYFNIEKQVQISDTEIVPISVSSALIADSRGAIDGALEVFVDLTEMKKMEEEIARVKSLAALGEVAAVVAHEVRNPLSGIGGFAMLLHQELGEDHPQIGYLDNILEGVKKLNHCVSSLLTYAGEINLVLEPGDLRTLLQEVVSLFRMELSSTDSKSKIELSLPDREVICCFERENLSGALINLLKNAEQAMPSGGMVRIELTDDSSEAKISVTDEGAGIPGEVRSKIFTPFFTTKEGGTGLGLALVKKIVDAHRGKVELYSDQPGGAKFTITLPRVEKSTQQQ